MIIKYFIGLPIVEKALRSKGVFELEGVVLFQPDYSVCNSNNAFQQEKDLFDTWINFKILSKDSVELQKDPLYLRLFADKQVGIVSWDGKQFETRLPSKWKTENTLYFRNYGSTDILDLYIELVAGFPFGEKVRQGQAKLSISVGMPPPINKRQKTKNY